MCASVLRLILSEKHKKYTLGHAAFQFMYAQLTLHSAEYGADAQQLDTVSPLPCHLPGAS